MKVIQFVRTTPIDPFTSADPRYSLIDHQGVDINPH